MRRARVPTQRQKDLSKMLRGTHTRHTQTAHYPHMLLTTAAISLRDLVHLPAPRLLWAAAATRSLRLRLACCKLSSSSLTALPSLPTRVPAPDPACWRDDGAPRDDAAADDNDDDDAAPLHTDTLMSSRRLATMLAAAKLPPLSWLPKLLLVLNGAVVLVVALVTLEGGQLWLADPTVLAEAALVALPP